jgi:hypothetical protein
MTAGGTKKVPLDAYARPLWRKSSQPAVIEHFQTPLFPAV